MPIRPMPEAPRTTAEKLKILDQTIANAELWYNFAAKMQERGELPAAVPSAEYYETRLIKLKIKRHQLLEQIEQLEQED